MTPTTESVIPLAQRWAGGDRKAGGELIVLHDGWIRRFAWRASRPGEDVDDIAQVMRIGFLRAAAEELPSTERLLRWKLSSRMRDAVWAMRNGDLSVDCDRGDEGFGPSHDPATVEDQIDLHAMMARSGMTYRQRRVVAQMLCGDLGLDVARALGVHPMIVAREWDRGIAALRATVEPHAAAPARTVIHGPKAREFRIVELLTATGPLSGPSIRRVLGDSEERVLRALRRLAASGRVTISGTPNKRFYTVAAAREAA